MTFRKHYPECEVSCIDALGDALREGGEAIAAVILEPLLLGAGGTLNDDMKKIREMSRWIVKNLGQDVPVHFSRFIPHYKLADLPPTPIETLSEARKTAMDAGVKFVYIGNIRHDGENTFCPKCKKTLIERKVYTVVQNNILNGKCRFCNTAIPGVWS